MGIGKLGLRIQYSYLRIICRTLEPWRFGYKCRMAESVHENRAGPVPGAYSGVLCERRKLQQSVSVCIWSWSMGVQPSRDVGGSPWDVVRRTPLSTRSCVRYQ